MSDPTLQEIVEELLEQLEQALLKADLWSQTHPSEAAMSSSAPFACDSMPLEAWLQFIFIPKMRILLAQGDPLPTNIAIQPMAEEMFKNHSSAHTVLVTLGKIDDELSGQAR